MTLAWTADSGASNNSDVPSMPARWMTVFAPLRASRLPRMSFPWARSNDQAHGRFETRRVSREMRGRTNASVNADSANLARAVAAARDQIEAVSALARSGRLARLPPEHRAAAAARLRAPEATLAELAARLDTTKWVVRQRLRRVVDEAAR